MLLPANFATLVRDRWKSAELLAVLPAHQNQVFAGRVGRSDVIFRVTPDSHRTAPLIQNELDWMSHLQKQGIHAPGVVGSQHERQFETFAFGHEIFHVVAFERVPGIAIAASGHLSEQVAERWGRLHGRMNRIAMDFHPNPPFRWAGETTGITAMSQYTEALGKNLFPILSSAVNAIGCMEKTPHNYGIVHGDLHDGNVHLAGDDLYPLDFDECCYHWRMFDVAHVLYCLYFDYVQNGKELQALSNIGQVLLSGFEAECPMTTPALPHFLIYRLGLLAAWTHGLKPAPLWMATAHEARRQYLRKWSLDEIESTRIVNVFCQARG